MALMQELRPGTSPPPVNIPMRIVRSSREQVVDATLQARDRVSPQYTCRPPSLHEFLASIDRQAADQAVAASAGPQGWSAHIIVPSPPMASISLSESRFRAATAQRAYRRPRRIPPRRHRPEHQALGQTRRYTGANPENSRIATPGQRVRAVLFSFARSCEARCEIAALPD